MKAYDSLVLGRFDGRSSLKTWLYRIVTRTAIDLRRSRARRKRLTDALPEGVTFGEEVAADEQLVESGSAE